ncbi:hypothetical protein ACFSTH_11800 [Paenibacillus yanchengensis]|uniref:Uncharacterized protein n=1 Tax=Paenibacillus yanchengensis TaxID=2035833 RepID=A0ABW4YR69_9BACL
MTNQTTTIEEVAQERETYKLAFQTVMKYLDGYSKENDDGSILLGLTFFATDELSEVDIDAFMLIEEGFNDEEEDVLESNFNTTRMNIRNEVKVIESTIEMMAHYAIQVGKESIKANEPDVENYFDYIVEPQEYTDAYIIADGCHH